MDHYRQKDCSEPAETPPLWENSSRSGKRGDLLCGFQEVIEEKAEHDANITYGKGPGPLSLTIGRCSSKKGGNTQGKRKFPKTRGNEYWNFLVNKEKTRGREEEHQGSKKESSLQGEE